MSVINIRIFFLLIFVFSLLSLRSQIRKSKTLDWSKQLAALIPEHPLPEQPRLALSGCSAPGKYLEQKKMFILDFTFSLIYFHTRDVVK